MKDEKIPNDPGDEVKFIQDTLKLAKDVLKSAFSAEEYLYNVYGLTCMENDFHVQITEDGLTVESPHNGTEEIRWDELVKVSIATNDKGPFTADVFMVFFTEYNACVVPQGNSRYDDLYQKVTAFKDVNFEAIIKAMSSSENREFVIWEKKAANDTKVVCYALFHCDPSTRPPFKLELGMKDGSVFGLEDCQHIPDALEKLGSWCEKEGISKSEKFTLIYPIYMDAMDSEHESVMHNIAFMVKEKADAHKWEFDRIGGLTGKDRADFLR